MSDLERTKNLIERALSLAKADPSKALALLEDELHALRRSATCTSSLHHLSLLARNAGIVAQQIGDAACALSYFEEVVATGPDASLYFVIGDLSAHLGRRQQAESAFAKCMKLAKKEGDEDLLELASKAAGDLM